MPVAILFFCKESFVRVYAGAFIIFCVAHREEFLGEEQKVFFMCLYATNITHKHTHTHLHTQAKVIRNKTVRAKTKLSASFSFHLYPG